MFHLQLDGLRQLAKRICASKGCFDVISSFMGNCQQMQKWDMATALCSVVTEVFIRAYLMKILICWNKHSEVY